MRVMWAVLIVASMGVARAEDHIQVIPRPAQVVVGEGAFQITSELRVACEASLAKEAAAIADWLRRATRSEIPVEVHSAKPPGAASGITLERGGDLGAEAYRLRVTADKIVIQAGGRPGAYYAGVTLRQLLPPAIESERLDARPWRIPCVEIDDTPRYGWRGLMIDSCRHFQPVAELKKLIETMAYYKLNRFHWHLTEDEGWRIEIAKYPKLTEIGAWRGDGAYRYGGFYTQDEIREVIDFARERHIMTIPEIEMPGHAMAALVAYPELSCGGKPYSVGKGGLRHFNAVVGREAFCAGREETFQFLEDVLTETIALFDGPYVHIGGDERPADAWTGCERCQARMKAEGLKNESELQSYFIRRIEKFLNARSKTLIGWDEILEGGLAPNATVMSWRGMAGGIDAARQNHDVIMSPTSHCYFDYLPGDAGVEPAGWGPLIDVELVYSFEPTPAELSPEQARHVLGAQANVWTEMIRSQDMIEYMTFPRLLALAEVVWSPAAARRWADFERRLLDHYARLDNRGINFRIPPPQGPPARSLFVGETKVALATPIPGATIRYRIDGRYPLEDAPVYRSPITVTRDTTLSARTYLPSGRASAPMRAEFRGTQYREAVVQEQLAPGLKLRRFTGRFSATQELDRATSSGSEVVPVIELPENRPTDQFGLEWSGYMRVPADGVYSFSSASDDGSIVLIDEQLVVNNDGPHTRRDAVGEVALRGGLHALRVQYFDIDGPESLVVRMRGPAGEWGVLREEMLYHRP